MASFKDRFRLLAIVPAVFSIVAFVLQLTALLAGMKEGQLENMYMFTLNTSHVGQDVVKFAVANSSLPTVGAKSVPTPTPTRVIPRGLFASATSAIGAEASSLGSKASAALASEVTAILPSGFPLPGANSSTTSYLLRIAEFAIEAALGSIISPENLAADEAELVQYVTDYLGIQDYYSFNMLNWCTGNYTSANGSSSAMSLNATTMGSSTDVVTNMTCSTYSGAINNFATTSNLSIPSSFTILNINASVPLLEGTGNILPSINSLVQTLAVVIKAFHVGSLIGTFGTFALSVAAFFLPNYYPVAKAAFLFSTSSAIFQIITSLIFSILLAIIVLIVNAISEPLQLYAKRGTGFLAVTWIAFVLALLTSMYWSVIWFVETRNTSFQRRLRTASQHGNYYGIAAEVWKDIRRPVTVSGDGMKEGLVKGAEPSSSFEEYEPPGILSTMKQIISRWIPFKR